MRSIALLLLLAAPPALAQDPTARRHVGFFLRVDAGVGYLGSSAVDGGVVTSVVGFAIPFGIAVGGAVTENLIVAGDLWGVSAFSPTFTVGGSATAAGGNGFGLGGIGVNVTWYFMPDNLYVSATPSISGVSLWQGGVTSTGKTGFGLKAAVGKEWWVGDHWGLGVAGQFLLGVNQGKVDNPSTWTTVGGALALSATYN